MNSGVIFKDKLDNLSLSEKALRRLEDNYADDFEHMDDVYYHLYLLYSRKEMPVEAERYVQKLKEKYPESQWTTLLTDPYYKENAQFGVHIEDSLYAATYEAFKANRYQEAKANARISAERFPLGENRDKFLFIGGLSKLNDGDANACIKDMQEVVEKYPNSRISEIAGMIVNGVNAGKRLHGGKFDLEDVWNRRSIVLNDQDSTQQKVFTNERNANFVFMLVYQPDSVNENQVLFEMAKYNFTHYLVRNFDMNIEEQDGLHRMIMSGFRSYDEAWQYAHALSEQTAIIRHLNKARAILISEQNLELLGTQFTYNEYEKFYQKHFASLKLKQNAAPLLTEPTEIVTEKKKIEETEAGDEEILDDKNDIDNSLEIMEDVAPSNSNESIEIKEDINPETPKENNSEKETEVERNEDEMIVIDPKVEEPKKETPKKETPKKEAKPEILKKKETPKKETPKKEIQKKEPLEENEDVFYFNDDTENTQKQENKNQKSKEEKKDKDDKFDLEDEYFDFDGF